jgi:1-acyl-sn-glycerol-3-phosphate acyltransferase
MNNKKYTSQLAHFYSFGARILVRILYKVETRGFENFPKNGGFIIIANHTSYMDGLLLHYATGCELRYVINRKVYQNPLIHYFLKMNRTIPIEANKTEVVKAIEEITTGIADKDIIVLFPEGVITYTGNLSRFKPGVEWMVNSSKAPLVPIAIKGLYGSIFSRKNAGKWYRYIPLSFRRRIVLTCGETIPPSDVKISYLQKVLMRLMNR